jgi:carbon storage regulator CsrA
MLVFNRRTGECVRIGDDVRIKIIRIDEESVTFKITKPSHVTIIRSELFKQVTGGNDRELK